jgi:hypothetical protein
MIGDKAHSVEVIEEMFCRWEEDPEAARRISEAAKRIRETVPASS